jgi:hypothetical protein
MQKRAGLLFLSKNTGRVLLILKDSKWTVPTFVREGSVFEDVKPLTELFVSGKIIPVELYLSADNGFEFGTYICLVEFEFCPECVNTFSWANINELPNSLHPGLKNTLSNQIIKTKITTILELETIKTY